LPGGSYLARLARLLPLPAQMRAPDPVRNRWRCIS